MTTLSLERDVGWGGRLPEVRYERRSQPARSLADAVELAVGHVEVNSLRAVARLDAPPVFQARSLLALLTFCYARQVYSSTTIAAQLRRDFDSLRLNEDELPDGPLLQRFRGENKEPLGFCLKAALLFMAGQKIREGFVTHVKVAHLAREANRRIVTAMFMDSLESERNPGDASRDLSFQGAGMSLFC